MAAMEMAGAGRRHPFRRLLRRAGDCLAIAAANLLQLRLRLAVAVAGTAMPILLLLLQLALVQAVRTEVTRLYDDFAFDLVLVPVTYEYMFSSGVFDSVRLAQARAIDGVADVFSLNVSGGAWTGEDRKRSPILVIGVDDKPDFIADPQIRGGLGLLRTGNDVLVDRFSAPGLGSLSPGTAAFLDDRPVTIAGRFSLGMFFYADGAALARNVNLPQLTGEAGRSVSFGLIRLVPGVDARAVRSRLEASLPGDVRLLSRQELREGEQGFFLSTKPLGIMVQVGLMVAFLAGAVGLWQVLSAEISRRLGEFATMGAMGFGSAFVLGVGFCETLLLGLAAFLPAIAIGGAILFAVQAMTHMPAAPTPALLLKVLGIVLLMCAFAAVSVARRIARAQPADLF